MGYISQMDADHAILPVVYYVFAVLSSSIEHDDRALNIDSARDVKAPRRVQLHVSVTRERHDQSMPWCCLLCAMGQIEGRCRFSR
mmetsp:Transcript_25256/g.57533  ORF Transcript_25256/g.57533 Transcript_25256/m.57533 type:complete len:85 (+) Transcript_25256:86-340(+)